MTTNLHIIKAGLAFVVVLLLSVRPVVARAASVGPYQNNAVYLARSYVASSAWQGDWLHRQLEFLSHHGVRVLAVNVADIMPDGNLSNGCQKGANGACTGWLGFTTCSKGYADAFLAKVKEFESTHPDVHFELLAWFNNGHMRDVAYRVNLDRRWNSDHTAIVDNPVQQTLAANAARFVSPAGDCATPTRQFDGVLYDFEPSGIPADPHPDPVLPSGVSNQFEGIKQTVATTRVAFQPYGATVAVAAHSWASAPAVWTWTSAQYYYIALNADAVFAMQYDSGSQTVAAYAQWLTAQANDIVDSVSGKHNHLPEPNRPPRVFFGLPAFGPDKIAHRESAENIRSAANNPARTLLRSIMNRCASDATFCRYVAGAAMYLQRSGYVCDSASRGQNFCASLNSQGLYDDSSGGSYYASQDDWASWVVYWLTVE